MDNSFNNPDVAVNKWKCQKCQDTGIIKEPNGTCHVCYDCLIEGRLDQHSKNVPDSKIKL